MNKNISPSKHDISMCTGYDLRLLHDGSTEICDCELKQSCHRYQAYCNPDKPTVVSCIFPLECMDNNHNLYWKI